MKSKLLKLQPGMVMSALFLITALLSACPQSSESSSTDTSSAETGSTATSESTAPAEDTAPADAADDGKGVGPVKSVTLATIDPALVAEGKKIFDAKCTACHKADANKYVGPGLKDVTGRRKPEWIMNMILNPTEMTQKDPQAKKLFSQFMIQMTNQNMDEKQARAVLEFFRSNDAK